MNIRRIVESALVLTLSKTAVTVMRGIGILQNKIVGAYPILDTTLLVTKLKNCQFHCTVLP